MLIPLEQSVAQHSPNFLLDHQAIALSTEKLTQGVPTYIQIRAYLLQAGLLSLLAFYHQFIQMFEEVQISAPEEGKAPKKGRELP